LVRAWTQTNFLKEVEKGKKCEMESKTVCDVFTFVSRGPYRILGGRKDVSDFDKVIFFYIGLSDRDVL